VTYGSRAESEDPPTDVIHDITAVAQQPLENFGVLRVHREDLFPCALIEDELHGEDARLAGVLRSPRELVMTQVTYLDAVVCDWLGNVLVRGQAGTLRPPGSRRVGNEMLPLELRFNRRVGPNCLLEVMDGLSLRAPPRSAGNVVPAA
jgi:hypothetical protein